jgi:hypothetical protein
MIVALATAIDPAFAVLQYAISILIGGVIETPQR